MNFFRVIIISVLFLINIACSSTPEKAASNQQPQLVSAAKTEKKEPLLYTAKPCFTRMSDNAQRWAPDAMPFHLESSITSEANGQDGKSTVWRGLFASPSRGTFKTFTCSGSQLPDQPPVGVASTVESTSSPLVASLEFHPSYLQMDSDKAYAMAQQHGGANLIKKDPQQPVLYILERDAKQKAVFWYVIYGKSQAEAKGIGVFNASTGAFVRAGK
jgi:hypothetical protein